MLVGATFGLITALFLTLSGDESAHQVALKQPVKLAAMEGLYEGRTEAGIVGIGMLNPEKTLFNEAEEFIFQIEAPYALSLLGYHDIHAYVPGLKDLVYGNKERGIMGAEEKIAKGKIAIEAFEAYKDAHELKDSENMAQNRLILDENMQYFGYGYLKNPEQIVPPVAITFYAFHIMVALGGWFLVLFALVLFLLTKKDIEKFRVVLWAAVWSIPLGYIAGEAGWVVAEVGRQPWAIQDLMPVGVAATHIATSNVIISFTLFALLFTTLLIAEIKIMTTQIKIGPDGGH
jgi:cytochrome d ubiquinol oxidase subunit I